MGSQIMYVERLACAAILVLAVGGAQGALYKWVDENGRVQYSDRPPGSDKGGVQLSNRGIVVKKLEGGLTPEQKKAKDEENARAQAEKAKAEEQRRQDTALLQSFSSAKEIELKRDREIQGLNAAIANLRSQEKRVSERLEEDRKRAESFRRRKEPLPDPVKEDIVRGEGEQKVLAEQIKRKLDEIDAIDNKYASLKKRYLELRRN
jgi:hypothetical protein